MEAGYKKCILDFVVDRLVYGYPLILVLNIKEDNNILKFRNKLNLPKNDFSNKKLF